MMRIGTVKYEDGDGENLHTKDCVCTIKLYQDIENGVVNEWMIGNEYVNLEEITTLSVYCKIHIDS